MAEQENVSKEVSEAVLKPAEVIDNAKQANEARKDNDRSGYEHR